MKSAILAANEGFDILFNGTPPTFRDLKGPAFEAARIIKRKNRGDIIEMVDRSTGARVVMLQDGAHRLAH
jgi:hypothetical protein